MINVENNDSNDNDNKYFKIEIDYDDDCSSVFFPLKTAVMVSSLKI